MKRFLVAIVLMIIVLSTVAWRYDVDREGVAESYLDLQFIGYGQSFNVVAEYEAPPTPSDYAGGRILFIGLIGMGAFLTWGSFRAKYILFAVASSMAWMALGFVVMLQPEWIALDMLSSLWQNLMGALFIVLSIVVLLMYWFFKERRYEISHSN